MLPQDWRKSRQFSQENVANMLGIKGKNPARTWQRWESGERKPPLAVMMKIEALTDGKVTITSWMKVRETFVGAKQVSA
jgi:transcriptional regulator with XRE-family HTH domain